MKRALNSFAMLIALASAAPHPALAQARSPQVPLKIDIVIAREAGTKKISRLPYSLWVTANREPARETSLRMGVQVPVVQNVFTSTKDEGGAKTPTQSYSYRNVGTNIDCLATSTGDGRYAVAITLSDSGIQAGPGENQPAGVPAFREFTSRFYLLLKDGQSATYTSATDPVTGETLKVDVTLNVLK